MIEIFCTATLSVCAVWFWLIRREYRRIEAAANLAREVMAEARKPRPLEMAGYDPAA